LRSKFVCVSGRPQYSEQVAKLIQGLPTGLLGGLHGLDCGLGVVAGRGLGCPTLHHHQTHLVRHNVMQLTRDSRPLLGDSLAGFCCSVPFETGGMLLEHRQVGAPDPDSPTDVPEHEHEDDPADRIGQRLPLD